MWHQIPICLEWDKEDEIWIRARSPSIQPSIRIPLHFIHQKTGSSQLSSPLKHHQGGADVENRCETTIGWLKDSRRMRMGATPALFFLYYMR